MNIKKSIHNLFHTNEKKGITYTLLWNTKPHQLDNHLVVNKSNDGITTIHKKINDEIKNDLKVLVFTDFHLDHKVELCNYTYTMIAKNIMNVKPDFVILCGDNITSIENVERAKQFAQLMEDLNVYWTFILGNHEGKEYPQKNMMSRSEQINLFSQYKHCLIDSSIKKTSDGETVWGDGNHVINVLNSNNQVTQTFFFLDSGTKMSEEDKMVYKHEIEQFIAFGKAKPDETEFYDYIKDIQIKWFKEVMTKYPNSNATIFSHTPLKDMEDAYLSYYNAYKKKEHIFNPIGVGQKNIWPYTISTGAIDNCDINMIIGRRAEDICYSPHDVKNNPIYPNKSTHTQMFDAMIEFGGKHPAFFCGHDHQNDFVFDEVIHTKNGNKTITMGYIEPTCYSSNNFWTKGMLHLDPLNLKTMDKYHLIQGYSIINFALNNLSKPFTITHHTNYDVWNGEHYEEVIQLIKKNRDGKDYKPALKEIYPNDPNIPVK